MTKKTYTILTFTGSSYERLDNTSYLSYTEALEAIKASQEMDVCDCIGVTTEDREDTLANETPCPQLLITDYDGKDIPDNAERFSDWIID